MYFLCGMFVQLFELQSRHFTNFHYSCYYTASCWWIIRVLAPLVIKELIKCFDTVSCLAFTVELKHDHLCIISSSGLNFSPYILPKSSRKWKKCILGKHAEHASQVNILCVISCRQTCCYSVRLPRHPCGLDVKKNKLVTYLPSHGERHYLSMTWLRPQGTFLGLSGDGQSFIYKVKIIDHFCTEFGNRGCFWWQWVVFILSFFLLLCFFRKLMGILCFRSS